ncbi:AMP-binding protein [Agromyces sp. ZXT2-6]|uniref:AMP-binding protein n=1 Tax=Agromyces sp. ZXT2-6 TaxID=3461153 RepID=UPI004054DF31
MKPLLQVPVTDVAALRALLADALDGGPAVWPVPAPAGRGAAEPRFATASAGSRPVMPIPPSDAAAAASLGANGNTRDGEVVGEVGDGVAVVVETSGSTAAPKRVTLSAHALRASAEASAAALGGHGRWVLALPAHYVAGVQVLVRGIVAGTPPVAMAPDEPFTAEGFAAATMRLMRLRDALPRYTSLVPVQLARVVEAAEADPSGHLARNLAFYAAILVGGQRVDPGLVERAAAFGARVVRTYGSSETAGGCVYDGRPLPGVLARAVDGELELGGPTLADGYLDDPERTAAAFETDASGIRWYRTGDLGSVGDDGVLRVTGRADDVITSGGVKVVLGEVERAVQGVPGFGDAVAVAVPDPEWGERVAVVVAASADAGPGALDALRTATDAAGLPPAARPVRVVPMPAGDLPRLASGKPDRVAASALARAATEPDAG